MRDEENVKLKDMYGADLHSLPVQSPTQMLYTPKQTSDFGWRHSKNCQFIRRDKLKRQFHRRIEPAARLIGAPAVRTRPGRSEARLFEHRMWKLSIVESI